MIAFKKFTLENGLRVIVHEDQNTPLVTVNVLYDVGSRDESPNRTGFAHLFEHLMFGGSLNVKDFDEPIQNAGGDNNAFTNCDLTNFYNIVPKANVETALWLESDRMLQLAFSEKSLDVQRKVVVEEFKETTLNKPYGDLWHNMSALAYKSHPYRWPTIGLTPEHISESQLSDVKNFFYKHYRPNNAILTIAGNITFDMAKQLVEKWFNPIPPGLVHKRTLTPEPLQTETRALTLQADVPADAIFMAFPMPGRAHKDFAVYDLLSDILSEGASARFYKNLVKPAKTFSQLYAYISGTIDPGLFIIDGRLLPNVDVQKAIDAIWIQLEDLKENAISETELEKIKNKFISSTIFSDVSVLNKAINLAFYELMGDAQLINEQMAIYEAITTDDIVRVSKELFTKKCLNEIRYLKETDSKLDDI